MNNELNYYAGTTFKVLNDYFVVNYCYYLYKRWKTNFSAALVRKTLRFSRTVGYYVQLIAFSK